MDLVWVGGLRHDVTSADVGLELEQYGRISSVELYPSRGGSQFGLVRFVHPEDAQYVVDQLDGLEGFSITGQRSLKARFADGARTAAAISGDWSATKEVRGHLTMTAPPAPLLWVGNIGAKVQPAQVQELFSRYGHVASVKLFLAPAKDCQFGFVGMGSAEEGRKAMEGLDAQLRTPIYDQEKPRLKIRYAVPIPGAASRAGAEAAASEAEQLAEGATREVGRFVVGEAAPSKVLWIENVSRDATERDIKLLLSKFGQVSAVQLSKTVGVPYSSAFVTLASIEVAERALEALGSAAKSPIGWRSEPLKLHYARPKGAAGTSPVAAPLVPAAPQAFTAAAAPAEPPAQVAVAEDPAPAPVAVAQEAAAAGAPVEGPSDVMGQPQHLRAGEPLQQQEAAVGLAARAGAMSASQLALHAANGHHTADTVLQLWGQPPEYHPEQYHQQQHLAAAAGVGESSFGTSGLAGELGGLALHAGGSATNGPHGALLGLQQAQQETPSTLAAAAGGTPGMLHGHVAMHGMLFHPQPPATAPPAPAPPAPAPSVPPRPVQLSERCACCGASQATHGIMLQNCSGCQAFAYCGVHCQMIDWEGAHHHDCGRLAELMAALQGRVGCQKLVGAALSEPLGKEAALVRRVLECLAAADAAS